MGKCKDCKWWGLDEYPQIPSSSVGHKTCDAPQVGGGSYDDKARLMDDSLNSYESVGTGPEFGCIHWQSRVEYAFIPCE